MYKRFITIIIVLLPFAVHAQDRKKQDILIPANVIITAGQSNADGRVPVDELPDYIKSSKYNNCMWSYGSGDFLRADGSFSTFWPRVGRTALGDRWGFDAVVYYLLEQHLQKPFYVIKETMGGTAIDTLCTRSTHGKYWCADSAWLSRNSSASKGGKSLAKALTEHIGLCLDSLVAQGVKYNIRALLWHQGESDKPQAGHYYDNLKTLVAYVRGYLVGKTGDERYAQLPVICGTYSKNSRDRSAEVVEALYRLAEEDANFHVVDISDGTIQSDRLHFDARGAELLGQRVYDQLKEIILK